MQMNKLELWGDFIPEGNDLPNQLAYWHKCLGLGTKQKMVIIWVNPVIIHFSVLKTCTSIFCGVQAHDAASHDITCNKKYCVEAAIEFIWH